MVLLNGISNKADEKKSLTPTSKDQPSSKDQSAKPQKSQKTANLVLENTPNQAPLAPPVKVDPPNQPQVKSTGCCGGSTSSVHDPANQKLPTQVPSVPKQEKDYVNPRMSDESKLNGTAAVFGTSSLSAKPAPPKDDGNMNVAASLRREEKLRSGSKGNALESTMEIASPGSMKQKPKAVKTSTTSSNDSDDRMVAESSTWNRFS